MWGRGPIGSNSTCSALCQFSVTPSTTHNQIGPFWCCFLGGWVCICSRSLWVSPTNSPVSLGVSHAAASTSMGVFNQRFEALFPGTGVLGCAVCFTPLPFHPVYLCANVGPQGLSATTLWDLLAAAWPARSTIRHLPGSASCHFAGSPLRPGCPSPPLLPVWMNVSSLSPWLSDFHTVDILSILVVFCF